MFTGQTAADAIGIFIDLLMEFFNILVPFFVTHVHFAKDDVEIAITDMGVDFDFKRIGFANFHNFFDSRSNLVDRNDYIIGQEYFTLQFDRGLAVAAHIPDAVIGF